MTSSLTRRGLLAGAGALTLATPMLAPRLARAATPASFQLDWKINAQFAGLLVADDAGLYAANDAALEIRPWADGVNVVMDVAEGRADFACAEQNLIIAAQAQGAPIRAVATMFQASPYGLMAPAGASLTSLDVLRGKTVGVHVDGVKVMALVKGVTGIEDIAVVEIDYANKFDRAVSGEFAAVQCYVIDEPIGVAARTGAEPEVLKLSDYGFVSTAQTIVVSEATLADRPDLVRGVLAATFEGWTRALADKPGTAAMIVDRYVEEGSAYKDVAYQTRTLELLEPYVTGMGPMGVIDPVKWREASELMAAYGIVTALPDLESSLAPGFYG